MPSSALITPRYVHDPLPIPCLTPVPISSLAYLDRILVLSQSLSTPSSLIIMAKADQPVSPTTMATNVGAQLQLTAGNYVQIAEDAEHYIDAILTAAYERLQDLELRAILTKLRPSKCEFDGIALLLLTTPLPTETPTQTVSSRHRSSWPPSKSRALSLSDPHRRSRPRLFPTTELTSSNRHRVLFPN